MAMTPENPAEPAPARPLGRGSAAAQDPPNPPSAASGVAAGQAPETRRGTPGEVPIWFFVGSLLLLYGLIILGAGIYQFWHPPHTVLARDHASFWGGIALTILGGGFAVGFWPGRRQK